MKHILLAAALLVSGCATTQPTAMTEQPTDDQAEQVMMVILAVPLIALGIALGDPHTIRMAVDYFD